MMNKILSLPALPLLLASATAAMSADVGREVVIPFVASQGVLDWKVAGKDSLYVQGANGKWYLVRTLGPCPRLKTAMQIGFLGTRGDRLDRYGTLLAEGWRCRISSVTLGTPPPSVVKHG
jgi:hypothetical protein